MLSHPRKALGDAAFVRELRGAIGLTVPPHHVRAVLRRAVAEVRDGTPFQDERALRLWILCRARSHADRYVRAGFHLRSTLRTVVIRTAAGVAAMCSALFVVTNFASITGRIWRAHGLYECDRGAWGLCVEDLDRARVLVPTLNGDPRIVAALDDAARHGVMDPWAPALLSRTDLAPR